jgi:hypothetical protein
MLSNYSLSVLRFGMDNFTILARCYILGIRMYNFTILARIVVPLLRICINSLLIISALNWNLSNDLVLSVNNTLIDHSLLLDIGLSRFDSGFVSQRFNISGLNCLSVVRLRNS